jgi:hypothetical protein
MKRTTLSLLALLVSGMPMSSTHAGGTALVPLPAPIRTALDRRYPGWRLYDLDVANPGERRYCPKNAAQASVVHADFDSDGQTDYAVLIDQNHTAIILAFLARGGTYAPFTIEGVADALGITPRGTSYVTTDEGAHAPRRVVLTRDVVVVYRCEADTSQYIFKKGRFHYQE